MKKLQAQDKNDRLFR